MRYLWMLTTIKIHRYLGSARALPNNWTFIATLFQLESKCITNLDNENTHSDIVFGGMCTCMCRNVGVYVFHWICVTVLVLVCNSLLILLPGNILLLPCTFTRVIVGVIFIHYDSCELLWKDKWSFLRQFGIWNSSQLLCYD